MEVQPMDEKYIRIAELTENIVNVNKIIEMHRKQTKSLSMIRQYLCQRDEFIEELQKVFKSLNLELTLKEAA